MLGSRVLSRSANMAALPLRGSPSPSIRTGTPGGGSLEHRAHPQDPRSGRGFATRDDAAPTHRRKPGYFHPIGAAARPFGPICFGPRALRARREGPEPVPAARTPRSLDPVLRRFAASPLGGARSASAIIGATCGAQRTAKVSVPSGSFASVRVSDCCHCSFLIPPGLQRQSCQRVAHFLAPAGTPRERHSDRAVGKRNFAWVARGGNLARYFTGRKASLPSAASAVFFRECASRDAVVLQFTQPMSTVSLKSCLRVVIKNVEESEGVEA